MGHTVSVYFDMSRKQRVRKDLCMNGGEGRQCDKVCHQCDGWLARTAGYDIICFACGGVVHFLLQGYFIVNVCTISSKLSTSSVLCTYVWDLNAFSVHAYVCML